jgi:hypothetical protein
VLPEQPVVIALIELLNILGVEFREDKLEILLSPMSICRMPSPALYPTSYESAGTDTLLIYRFLNSPLLRGRVWGEIR